MGGGPIMNTVMTGFYVYGFTVPDARVTGLEVGLEGVCGGNIEVRSYAKLGAICEVVNAEEFSKLLTENVEDPNWVAGKAILHDHTISSFIDAGVIPLRFGSVVPDLESLNILLERESQIMIARLKSLHGQREFTVRVWVDRDELEPRLVEANPALDDLQAELNGSTPGRQYLFKRKLKDALEVEVKKVLPELRREAFSRLEDAVTEIKVLERIPASQATNPGVLECAVLLDSISESLLLGELAGWPDRLAMRAELSGPFAPYSFATSEPKLETVATA
jgi:hypothetical protein